MTWDSTRAETQNNIGPCIPNGHTKQATGRVDVRVNSSVEGWYCASFAAVETCAARKAYVCTGFEGLQGRPLHCFTDACTAVWSPCIRKLASPCCLLPRASPLEAEGWAACVTLLHTGCFSDRHRSCGAAQAHTKDTYTSSTVHTRSMYLELRARGRFTESLTYQYSLFDSQAPPPPPTRLATPSPISLSACPLLTSTLRDSNPFFHRLCSASHGLRCLFSSTDSPIMRTSLAALPLVAVAQAVVFEADAALGKSAPGGSSVEAQVIPDSYIIKFKDHVDDSAVQDHHTWVTEMHNGGEQQRLELRKRSLDSTAAEIFSGMKHAFNIGKFRGYSGHFHESTMDEIRNHPDVSCAPTTLVQIMRPVDAEGDHKCDGETEKQAPWGLARISHRERLNFGTFNKYLFAADGGEGVDAYVIDTGCNTEHVDFEGRAKWGKTIPSGDEDEDGNGHGTHCSGTIAGKKYGVAKKANIYAVKVLRSNGSGSMSDVVKGVEYAAESHAAQVKAAKDGKRKGFKGSVANMSLGGGKTMALDAAVNAAVDAGVHFAVAAGNDNADACNYSPAAAGKPLTVGASALDDSRAYFSNYGKCTDIFAPGLSILSTWIGSKYAVNTISGTSMASPHICGLLAYYLSLQPASDSEFAVATISPQTLKHNLISISTEGALSDMPDKTPNKLAWNGGGCSNFSDIVSQGGYRTTHAPSMLEMMEEAAKDKVSLVTHKVAAGADKLADKMEKLAEKLHDMVDEEIDDFLADILCQQLSAEVCVLGRHDSHAMHVCRSCLPMLPPRLKIGRRITSPSPFGYLAKRGRSCLLLRLSSCVRFRGASVQTTSTSSSSPVTTYIKRLAMLRRTDSRSTHGRPLGRSKSTSSIKTLRANARGMSPSFGRPSPSPPPPSMARKQSVRFAGPNARPRRPLAIRATQQSVQPPDGSSTLGRLRKSKSMLTSGDRLRDWLASENKENEEEKPMLRAANSMTVLRQHDRQLTDSPSRGANSVAHRRPKPQPLKSPRRQYGSSVSFPKSLRNSSNGSGVPLSAFSGTSTPNTRRSTLRVTARRVSHSLKSKFRVFFGRPKSADEAIGGSLRLPDPVSSDDCGSYRLKEDTSEPEDAYISQVPSHVPSLHAVPSNQQLRSRKGSLDSLHADDKSRVTSWTNSTIDTVMSPSSDTEWERQRLSVIKENGMHVSSTRFKTPLMNSSSSRGHVLPTGCTIDSQRIYSALLKRFDETQRRQQDELVDDLVPPRGISAEHSTSRKRSPPTIRCVQPNGDVFRDKQRDVDEDPMSRGDEGPYPTRLALSYQPYPKPTAGDGKGLSPEQKSRADRSPDRCSESSVDPTCHLFRTTSRYRRALRENMRAAEDAERPYDSDGRCLSVLSALSLPTRCPSTAGSERNIGQSDGESVYSCATEPRTTRYDADAQEDDEEMTQDQTPRSFFAAHDRNVSSTSSVEWKTWLSANVSKLETPSTTMSADSHGDVSYKPPAFGHVREEAEIESPGDVLKQRAVDSGTWANARPAKQPAEVTTTTTTTTMTYGRTASVDENSPPAAVERSFDVVSGESFPNPWRDSLRTSCHTGTRSCKTGFDIGTPKKDEHTALRVRAQRRQRMAATHSAQSSPGLTAAVEKQFGKADMGSPVKKQKKPVLQERRSSVSPAKNEPEVHVTTGPTTEVETDTCGPDWEAQVLGSRRMVDLFLSSRRRRIESSRTETESENMSMAFL
ncbi:hypothetical protein L249_0916 [Ophiocordyceps polyrhachis-furcata BCC 54312]|uniref:Subtilisin-like protease n=1 Tax=Ophiocordyceps polyrhachis-furcata BCC 54312 TaxID=1330021 RepID=A0A367LEP1_9HYPO|nr:hypothetical protein L249_0916 [Ophiocordyceps polyrhachis-furcata BCC 54312]